MMPEPIGLFRRLENSFGENALTEALACVLSVSPIMRDTFIRKALKRDFRRNIPVTIETRPWSQQGTPDLQIRGGDACLILCEMKVDSPLNYFQWVKYQQILDGHTHVTRKTLIGVVAPWTSIDPQIIALRPEPEIWEWRDIHRLGSATVKRETNSVASFLIRELMELLEGHNMASISGFSEDDMAIFNGLAGINSKLEAFFSEVVDSIAKILQAKATGKKYTFTNYKGYQELWSWIEAQLQCPRTSIGIWVGVECASKKSFFQMGLWTDDMWSKNKTSGTKTLEQALRERGFEWDSYDGYSRYLENHLDVSKEAGDLVKSVANECVTFLSHVF